MVANLLIGLREGLEATLIVGILAAYLTKSGRTDMLRWVWAGVVTAVAISLGAGAALTFGPRGLSFEAQEAIGGMFSIVAVALVTWMIFWMARTSRHLTDELHDQIDQALTRSGWYVALVVLLAVGREGLETALFIWSAARATGSSTDPLIGALVGLLIAVGIGVAVTRGALRLDLRRFFTITGVLLVIIAAGVLSYGIHDLQEAGLLPGLDALAFDVSGAIPPSSWYGVLLKGTFNFSPRTTWLEMIAWVAYVVPVLTLFLRGVRPRRSAAPRRVVVTTS